MSSRNINNKHDKQIEQNRIVKYKIYECNDCGLCESHLKQKAHEIGLSDVII